jgi:hypothetical protein
MRTSSATSGYRSLWQRSEAKVNVLRHHRKDP